MNTVSTVIGAIGLIMFLGVITVVFTAAWIDYVREREAERISVEVEK